jgi:hypothetical protein
VSEPRLDLFQVHPRFDAPRGVGVAKIVESSLIRYHPQRHTLLPAVRSVRAVAVKWGSQASALAEAGRGRPQPLRGRRAHSLGDRQDRRSFPGDCLPSSSRQGAHRTLIPEVVVGLPPRRGYGCTYAKTYTATKWRCTRPSAPPNGAPCAALLVAPQPEDPQASPCAVTLTTSRSRSSGGCGTVEVWRSDALNMRRSGLPPLSPRPLSPSLFVQRLPVFLAHLVCVVVRLLFVGQVVVLGREISSEPRDGGSESCAVWVT